MPLPSMHVYYYCSSSSTYVILVGIVERIDHGGFRGPLILIHRSTKLSHIAVGLKPEDGEKVVQKLLCINRQL